MATRLISILALALLLGACESTPPDAKPDPTPVAQATATPAASPSPEATVAAPVAWKVGDKVKVTINGAAVDATIVSIDEKAGKATVKVQGETKDRIVNLTELAKE
jgi:PBP1b-binding outer membrane lipoprotein LpoB